VWHTFFPTQARTHTHTHSLWTVLIERVACGGADVGALVWCCVQYPVFATDGHCYERKAIEAWFLSKGE
jgi:hypothetical protein